MKPVRDAAVPKPAAKKKTPATAAAAAKPKPKPAARKPAAAKAAPAEKSPPPARPIGHWRTPAGRAARAVVRSLAGLLLVLSVLEMLLITLVPTPGSVSYSHPNWHAFATIRLYLRHGTVEEQILQIGGNIALGFVLGFLLPQITPYLRGLIRVEVVTALLIAVAELVQHFFIHRSALNVDDLILAGAGAALGYVPLGRMFGMRLHPDHLHWWQRLFARVFARGAK
ncbi:MAG TPA: VanZ family protein [Actinospica sp.]|nr:VanZ family protein [Actinospica sp.]